LLNYSAQQKASHKVSPKWNGFYLFDQFDRGKNETLKSWMPEKDMLIK
jgi:hypothetical protein